MLLAQQEAVNQSHIPSGVRSEAESMECSCTYIPCHTLLPYHPKSVRNRAVPNHRVLLAIRSMQSQPKLLESLRGGCNRRKQRMAQWAIVTVQMRHRHDHERRGKESSAAEK